MKRYLDDLVTRDLAKKMVFVTMPSSNIWLNVVLPTWRGPVTNTIFLARSRVTRSSR